MNLKRLASIAGILVSIAVAVASCTKPINGVTEPEPEPDPDPEIPEIQIPDGLDVKVNTIEVVLPEEIPAEELSGYRLSNIYGDYPLVNTKSVVTKGYGTGDDQGQTITSHYLGNGTDGILFLLNEMDIPMMCCANPDANKIDAESTAMAILLTHPLLAPRNTEEEKATIAAIEELGGVYASFVGEVEREIRTATRNCTSPRFDKIDRMPVIRALVAATRPNYEVPRDGLYTQDVKRDNGKVSLKIMNNYRRVIHIYAKKEWMDEDNIVAVKSENVCYTLSDVMESIMKDLGQEGSDDYKDFQETVKILEDEGIEGSMPYPYVLEPTNANYWKIVKGSIKGSESSIYESVSGEMAFDLGDADNLLVDVYSMGYIDMDMLQKMPPLDVLKLSIAYMHSAYNDYLKPLIAFAIGFEKMVESMGSDNYKYDLRYGARKFPERAFMMKLGKNFSPEKQKVLVDRLLKKDYFGAFLYPVEYAWDQVMGNNDNEDKRTYWNLIYNMVKKWLNIGVVPQSVRDGLKKTWNNISFLHNANFAGQVIKVSELALDLGGGMYAIANSQAVNSFRIDRNDSPTITVKEMGALVDEGTARFSWDTYKGRYFGPFYYDLVFHVKSKEIYPLTFKIEDLEGTLKTIDLNEFPEFNHAIDIKCQIIAHHPANRNMIYAKTEFYNVEFKAPQHDRSDLDDVPGENL